MTNLEKAAQELENEATRMEAWIKEQSPTYRQIEDQGATMQTVRAYRKAAQFFREKIAKQVEQEISQALTHPGKEKGDIDPLVIAFLQGAKYWEYEKEKATMWQSDQTKVLQEGTKRLNNGQLGKSIE